jgi:hypothetical protein
LLLPTLSLAVLLILLPTAGAREAEQPDPPVDRYADDVAADLPDAEMAPLPLPEAPPVNSHASNVAGPPPGGVMAGGPRSSPAPDAPAERDNRDQPAPTASLLGPPLPPGGRPERDDDWWLDTRPDDQPKPPELTTAQVEAAELELQRTARAYLAALAPASSLGTSGQPATDVTTAHQALVAAHDAYRTLAKSAWGSMAQATVAEQLTEDLEAADQPVAQQALSRLAGYWAQPTLQRAETEQRAWADRIAELRAKEQMLQDQILASPAEGARLQAQLDAAVRSEGQAVRVHAALGVVDAATARITPIYLVPTEWKVDSDEVRQEQATLQRAMDDVEAFVERELGIDLAVAELRIVPAGPLAHYGSRSPIAPLTRELIDEDGDGMNSVLWDAVAADVASLRATDPSLPPLAEVPQIYVTFVKGTRDWPRGRLVTSDRPGLTVLGDWVIQQLSGADGDNGQLMAMSTVVHELTHTLGVLHPKDYGGSELELSVTSPVGSASYPDAGYSDWERAQLLSPTGPGLDSVEDAELGVGDTWAWDPVDGASGSVLDTAPSTTMHVEAPTWLDVAGMGRPAGDPYSKRPWAVQVPIGTEVDVELRPDAGGGQPPDAVVPAVWIRTEAGMRFIDDRWRTRIRVEPEATIVLAPPPGTRVPVRFDDATVNSPGIQVLVDGRTVELGTDGSATLPVGSRVTLSAELADGSPLGPGLAFEWSTLGDGAAWTDLGSGSVPWDVRPVNRIYVRIARTH